MQTQSHTPLGISTEEARRRLKTVGANTISEPKPSPIRLFLRRFWGPIPWMLEAALALEIFLRQYPEAVLIGALLIFNAAFTAVQEKRSRDALARLRQRLQINVRVLRDNNWQLLPAAELVPGDVIHLRTGDIVPADVQLVEGQLAVDQSALTGESLPVTVKAGDTAYSGTLVQRGEATARVSETGMRTRYGRTAELLQHAGARSNLERVVFSITNGLILVDVLIAVAVFIYALFAGISLLEMLPFILILLVASVPVALPTTFTVASALGTQELSQQGVLTSNLTVIEEAAVMDVLCVDKTGTLTQNRLSVAATLIYDAAGESDLIRLAAIASDPANYDPIDDAILRKAENEQITVPWEQRTSFEPFDPETKRSGATLQTDGQMLTIFKGAPQVIAALCAQQPPTFEADLEQFAAEGQRVIAVAAGNANALHLQGLIALEDPLHPDSSALINQLTEGGIRVIMISGDSYTTTRVTAQRLGLGERVCRMPAQNQTDEPDLQCTAFAEVLPEHKFQLVKSLQQHGHIVGMTGDGVNDAPALKQAQVSIAVHNATDAARAAASLILTQPGLKGILDAVRISRKIYQRMLTYTLNKILKTIVIVGFLGLGLIITNMFVITPLLGVLLIFANDFIAMTVATDRVHPSRKPNRWETHALMYISICLAVPLLTFVFANFLIFREIFHFSAKEIQTFSFLLLVFTAQGTLFMVRERDYLWRSYPSMGMAVASGVVVLLALVFASQGILMAPIPLKSSLALLLAVLIFIAVLDFLKVYIFRRFGLHNLTDP